MHLNGSRLDITTDQLVQTLPDLNYRLLRIAVEPILWAMKAAAWLPNGVQERTRPNKNIGKNIDASTEITLASVLYDRTLFFDQALIAALNSAEQIVILGAGFDTRLFKFCLDREIALFEVDQVETQLVKKQALAKSKIDCEKVIFVAVDFANESWMQALTSSGFELGKRTFFLWEGVTYYLTEPAVKSAFSLMAQASSEGSTVAFDFFSESLVKGESVIGPMAAIFDWTGEPLQFGVSGGTNKGMNKEETRKAIEALMAETGFVLSKLRVVSDRIAGSCRPVSAGMLGGLAIAQVKSHR